MRRRTILALAVGLQQILMTELARNTARQRNGCNSRGDRNNIGA